MGMLFENENDPPDETVIEELVVPPDPSGNVSITDTADELSPGGLPAASVTAPDTLFDVNSDVEEHIGLVSVPPPPPLD